MRATLGSSDNLLKIFFLTYEGKTFLSIVSLTCDGYKIKQNETKKVYLLL